MNIKYIDVAIVDLPLDGVDYNASTMRKNIAEDRCILEVDADNVPESVSGYTLRDRYDAMSYYNVESNGWVIVPEWLSI